MQLNFIHDGQFYSAFEVEDALAHGVPMEILATAAASQAMASIDSAAVRARARHITLIDGQDAIYLAKVAEAEKALKARASTDPGAYPLLSHEAQALGLTIAGLAEKVVAAQQAWHQTAGRIEGERIAGKAGVKSANTVEAVLAAQAAAIATLDAL
ncbi:hypothetical protein [Pseudomonas sp. TCU-HL1]|uniref:hypothetical protein n=1 Tax=Pseudomonas sp. TCU-HL1 TaxID=1856685 RepID=UPI00083E56CF|nr:hypothetical protein [Pseudomonas sp. TCU-HL1]AOE85834.1 hypothetical protein THL1_3286 [Pseudomonas sp. TCU-HL1]